MTDRAMAPTWEAKLKRRHEFCERFVRAHHSGMADDARIKGARPLVPLSGPPRLHALDSDWWLQTDECVVALGFSYLGYLFSERRLLDHDWIIGRDDQEPWALVSEPYSPPAIPAVVEELRNELEKVGVELLEYPSEQSTHYPEGNIERDGHPHPREGGRAADRRFWRASTPPS